MFSVAPASKALLGQSAPDPDKPRANWLPPRRLWVRLSPMPPRPSSLRLNSLSRHQANKHRRRLRRRGEEASLKRQR